MIKACKVKNKLTSKDLTPSLKFEESVEFIEYDFYLDLSDFINAFDAIKNDKKLKIEESDYKFSKIIYDILQASNADESVYYDMKFWQWLSIQHLHEYCVLRWNMNLNDIKKSHYAKLLGGGGVGGFSLHSIARLFVPANILLKEKDGDDLLNSFFSIQQKEQSISQSTLALNSNLFVSIVRATLNLNTSQTVKAISRLNARKTGICLDILDDKEIAKLALENI